MPDGQRFNDCNFVTSFHDDFFQFNILDMNFFGHWSLILIQVGPCGQVLSISWFIVRPLVPRPAGFISPFTCLHELTLMVSKISATLFATKTGNFFSEDNHTNTVVEADHRNTSFTVVWCDSSMLFLILVATTSACNSSSITSLVPLLFCQQQKTNLHFHPDLTHRSMTPRISLRRI